MTLPFAVTSISITIIKTVNYNNGIIILLIVTVMMFTESNSPRWFSI